MKFKHLLCGAIIASCLFTAHADAKTISDDVFTAEATKAELKAKKFETTDIMGNTLKGLCVLYKPLRFSGENGSHISCNSILETSELFIAVGVNPSVENGPLPQTVVINNNGARVDIPVPSYTYDKGPSLLGGLYAEYQISLPLSVLKDKKITAIKGISVVMASPESGIGGDFSVVLKQSQEKEIAKTAKVYDFYLKLSAAN